MDEVTIFQNDFLRIYSETTDIFLETFKRGFSLDELNAVFSAHPEIGITSYSTLRNSINTAPHKAEKFAELKKRIKIDITNDELKAHIVFNISKEELEPKSREKLIRETAEALKAAGVTFGIKRELLADKLHGGKQYLIAEGLPPVDGQDCVIRMYELKDSKPEIREDGHADFYEMKLINRVRIGDWLGERLDATAGVNGISVRDNTLKAIPGKTVPLEYDKNTISEIYENGRTTLYSRVNGAVTYLNGKITVSNHLEINGDVGVSTGNLKFDGYVTIKGTVADGFSVEAARDIEINGELGVGNIKGITSTGGSIFIKGGISSKGRSEINAAKNVYAKFLENASVRCGSSAHIGYYCINSDVNAKEVIVESTSGHIMGGNILAEIRVSVPIIGSEIEKKTVIEVSGFDRKALMDKFENLVKKAIELKIEQQKLKLQISMMEQNREMDQYKRKQYSDLLEEMFNVKEAIKSLEEERKNISAYLKTRGDGEITIAKRIYPNCSLIIKKNIIEIKESSLAAVYYVQDNEVKQG